MATAGSAAGVWECRCFLEVLALLPLDVFPEGGHWVKRLTALILIFRGPSRLSPTVAVSFPTPTSSAQHGLSSVGDLPPPS